MGSDLSFEDLTNRDINDYKYTLVDDNASCSECDNGCYKLVSEPKNIDSEYSYHITWVTKDNYLSVMEESYDENKELLKKKFIKFEKIDKYYIMNHLWVRNVQKKHETELIIDKIDLNLGYSNDLFHTKNLKRIPQN